MKFVVCILDVIDDNQSIEDKTGDFFGGALTLIQLSALRDLSCIIVWQMGGVFWTGIFVIGYEIYSETD